MKKFKTHKWSKEWKKPLEPWESTWIRQLCDLNVLYTSLSLMMLEAWSWRYGEKKWRKEWRN